MVGSFFKCLCQMHEYEKHSSKHAMVLPLAAVVSNVSNKNIRLGLKAGIAKSAAGFDPVESMMLSSLLILHLHSIQNHTKADLREYEIEIQHQILLLKTLFSIPF